MDRRLIEELREVLLPYTNLVSESLFAKTPISELRVIAVVARRVDAMILLRIV